MNSLNILSTIGTPPPSPQRSRTPSADETASIEGEDKPWPQQVSSNGDGHVEGLADALLKRQDEQTQSEDQVNYMNEKTPLLGGKALEGHVQETSPTWWPKRMVGAVVGTIRIVLSTIFAPGRYVVACFYDEEGRFSAIMPMRRIGRKFSRRKPPAPLLQQPEKSSGRISRRTSKAKAKRDIRRSASIASTSTAVTSESESERPGTRDGYSDLDTPARNTRAKSLSMSSTQDGDEIAPQKKSIRIKLHNEEASRQKRASRKSQSMSKKPRSSEEVSEAAAAALKSPTSPLGLTGSKTTKYPRAPVPPRPLIPRRQPSYSTSTATLWGPQHQKTLILDLDETLIHSMSKGGRFTTGHMVEVKLNQPIGVGGGVIGPQVPILYYVHKRPHCDEFLRKVSKWYNLVVFTASVQEYADPVIDWLELERKYFSARYYRQHCTFRNSAYIKDLAQVEPDLSRVMIVDNSPLSYIFHEDNAVPIEGWISDPTDNDLLHLIPLLEGLQYVPDVRALLALRKGQPSVA